MNEEFFSHSFSEQARFHVDYQQGSKLPLRRLKSTWKKVTVEA